MAEPKQNPHPSTKVRLLAKSLGRRGTDKIGAVYSIVNATNGKVYVGKSQNVFARWRGHLKALRNGIHVNPHLQRAWDKCGEMAFQFNILEWVSDPNSLGSRELWYVTVLGAQNQEKGYNLNQVTEESFQASVETRERQSVSGKKAWEKFRDSRLASLRTPEYRELQRKVQTGIPRSQETRNKMSAASKGKKKSPEHAEAIRAAHIGWVPSAETRAKIGAAHKGRKHSPETKAKMSASRKGRKRGPYKKRPDNPIPTQET